MLKLLAIGLIGVCTSFAGMALRLHMNSMSNGKSIAVESGPEPTQVETDMTGIPVVVDGQVSGYLVFQINSTVDRSRLASKELDVSPYLLHAAIHASYESTEGGPLPFNSAFIQRLSGLIKDQANSLLGHDAVAAVNIKQFNFVPKNDVRGNVLAGRQD
jgi:hypothetical protein